MRKRGHLTIFSFILSLFLVAGCGGGGGGGGGGGILGPELSSVCPPIEVARNDSGNAVVAYLRDFRNIDKVYVNYYNGQNWSGPFQISEQDASHPKVAISDNGDAIFVWAENGYILAKIYKNGSWSQNYPVAGSIDKKDFSVAMYPNGNAIVV